MSNDIYRLKVIATGTGRCGTGFIAQYLTSAGLACGHERFFDWRGYGRAASALLRRHPDAVAESSWCAAPYLDRPELKNALLVHLVRHPKDYIGSRLKIWPGSFNHPGYSKFVAEHAPELTKWEAEPVTWAALRWLLWNEMIEKTKAARRDSITVKIEDEPILLLRRLQKHELIGSVDESQLFNNRTANTGPKAPHYSFELSDIHESVRGPVLELAARYGYEWKEKSRISVRSPPVIKAVITTLDNRPNNVEQLAALRSEPVSQIIFVNNGSIDDTRQWLDAQDGITVIHRENLGAGPGRNAGIDAAGKFDYLALWDGGIRPLRGGIMKMLDHLDRHSEIDVLGIEIADFETDQHKAWRRWPDHMSCEGHTYHNNRLSHTAYALTRARAWDGLRFCEEGPFSEAGWGCDDNEMAYQWLDAGIHVYVLTCACKHDKPCSGVHPYRRASGSFRRLEKETGIWPTNYGTAYERRVLWTEHNWPQHDPGVMWGEPWLTMVIKAMPSVGSTAKRIKLSHDLLRQRSFAPPWHAQPNPYNVVLWMPDADRDLERWAEERHLRRHWGHTALCDGQLVRRNEKNEDTWTGDFRIWRGDDWKEAIRPGAHYYALVKGYKDIENIMSQYNKIHPRKDIKSPPTERREIWS